MGTIAVDEPAVTDKLLDTKSMSNGADTVEREVMVIGDDTYSHFAPVSATLGLSVNVKSIASGVIASGAVASGAVASGAIASGAVASGAFASGAIGSGAVASGAIASGAIASGAIASGAVASGAFASGALAAGSVAAGAIVAGATSLVKLEDVASAGGDAGVPAMAIQSATPADTAGTDGDYAMLQMSAGRLWTAAAVTAASGAFASGSIASGAVASGAIASGALAAGSIATGAIVDTIVDDAAFTPATTRVFMAGFEADESSTDSVDEGDGGAARMTLDRKQIVTLQPHTQGGWSVANMTSGDGSTALTNSAQAIKASAGTLGGWFIYNPNASATYVPIYNVAAGSVTVGTTNPLMVLCIPATSAANLELVHGIAFSNAGFSAAAATTAGGNSAPATAMEVNFFYK